MLNDFRDTVTIPRIKRRKRNGPRSLYKHYVDGLRKLPIIDEDGRWKTVFVLRVTSYYRYKHTNTKETVSTALKLLSNNTVYSTRSMDHWLKLEYLTYTPENQDRVNLLALYVIHWNHRTTFNHTVMSTLSFQKTEGCFVTDCFLLILGSYRFDYSRTLPMIDEDVRMW